ncbi:YqaA family protein [Hyphomicrobium facile]|uniref:Membrane protein YqaA, SNARE-associated domain n=1 Tax=Hyphomicrobium facile TaxID=51670 RepID=A0A1I7NTB3_9HYPH|nr:YqaA family protein [Hyphomicrobium facile]SFV37896.1 membrane protein YqaA, SNARE-associated domain [Hyphomicrobium facile]
MLRGIYDWTMRMAASARAPWALAGVSFAESSFFPIPPDIMLIPMVLSQPRKAWWYATIATVASVIGGLLGYAIGYYLYDAIGEPILKFYGREHALDAFQTFVQEYGVTAVIVKGMTPIPYKVVTIAAGVGKMDILAFVGASIVARAMRFYLVASLLYFFGEPIRSFIEGRLALVTTAFLVLLIGGFVAVRYIF